MKTFSIALQEHLNLSTTTLATCLRLTWRDSNVYGFTTHDQALVIGGVTYLPAAGMNVKDLAANLNLDTDNTDVAAFLDDTVSEDDIRATRRDYATYRIFQVNYMDLSMGDKKDSIGHVGQITVNRQTILAELLGLMEAYGDTIGEITCPGCRANLGDQRCKVDLTPFTVASTIVSADLDLYTLRDSARTEADGYFGEGVIEFTSDGIEGKGNGLSYDIKQYTVGVMVTKTYLHYDMTGATYTMHAGCDKQPRTCTDRFNNKVNYRGEDKLRGPDIAIQVGRHG